MVVGATWHAQKNIVDRSTHGCSSRGRLIEHPGEGAQVPVLHVRLKEPLNDDWHTSGSILSLEAFRRQVLDMDPSNLGWRLRQLKSVGMGAVWRLRK